MIYCQSLLMFYPRKSIIEWDRSAPLRISYGTFDFLTKLNINTPKPTPDLTILNTQYSIFNNRTPKVNKSENMKLFMKN